MAHISKEDQEYLKKEWTRLSSFSTPIENSILPPSFSSDKDLKPGAFGLEADAVMTVVKPTEIIRNASF